MRAVRFHGMNDIRVEDVPEPDAVLADDDVLIAPLLCGICGTDLHEYIAGPIVTSVTPNPLSGATLPQILGHEFSARVIDVGRAVRSLKAGDRVSIQPLVSSPDDYYARRGLNHLSRQLAVIGLSWPWGGMCERAVVKAANAVKVPDGLSDTQAALIEPGAVAVYAVDRGRILGVGVGRRADRRADAARRQGGRCKQALRFRDQSPPSRPHARDPARGDRHQPQDR